jgi:ribosome recycling factor
MATYKLLTGNEIKERFQKKISGVRSNLVNSSILESITVNAYETKMHIHELATITKPEPSQLLITPFDKSLNQAISKAIEEASIGVNPVDDGAGLRLSFASMTQEDRLKRVKELHKLQEEARVDVRLHRQDLLKDKKKEKEDGLISEDELSGFEKQLQLEVENINKEIEEITKQKEAEILQI